MNAKNILPLVILATFACLSPLLAQSDSAQEIKEIAASTLVRKDETAPDFTCRTTDGKPFTLSAFKGKVVVLYFFDRLPMACMTEMKYIEKEIFQDLKKRDDFTILGIGRRLTREDVVKAGGDNKLTFPLAADPKQEIYARYFTKFVPRKIVVRKDGTIAHLSSGYQEYDGIVKLQAVLERELRSPAPRK